MRYVSLLYSEELVKNEYTILLLSHVYSSFLLLLQFATEYFPHPTFKDQNLIFYNALGSGKLSIGFNPIAIFNWIRNSMKMFKELGVKSYNMKGEIWGHINTNTYHCILFLTAVLYLS